MSFFEPPLSIESCLQLTFSDGLIECSPMHHTGPTLLAHMGMGTLPWPNVAGLHGDGHFAQIVAGPHGDGHFAQLALHSNAPPSVWFVLADERRRTIIMRECMCSRSVVCGHLSENHCAAAALHACTEMYSKQHMGAELQRRNTQI